MKYTTQDLLTLVQALKGYNGEHDSARANIDNAIAQLSGLLCVDIGEECKKQQERAINSLRPPLSREEAIKRLRQMGRNAFSTEWTFAMDNVRGWKWLEPNGPSGRRVLVRDGLMGISFEDVFPDA